MSEAEHDFQYGPLPISISEARIKLKQHDDQKEKVLKLHDDAVKEGDGIVIRVRQTVCNKFHWLDGCVVMSECISTIVYFHNSTLKCD